MKKLSLVAALSLLLAACATTTMPRVSSQPVFLGMTKTQLQTSFGPPLRRVVNSDGSEDWYYNFGTQTKSSEPVSETTETASERSVSYGVESSTSVTYREAPIRLSPTGRVVGDIPTGQVVFR